MSAGSADAGGPGGERFGRLLREPLVHFAILGASIFVLYGYVAEDPIPDERRIEVSAAKVEQLAELFARTWQRRPTRGELQALVDGFVREELAYREGVSLGLDRDDTVVRRRVRQKLEFTAVGLTKALRPTDEELVTHLRENAERFRRPSRLSFRQVFVDPKLRGEDTRRFATNLVASLQGESSLPAEALGDPTLLDHVHTQLAREQIERLFGDQFASAVDRLEVGSWQGPIQSAYGVHVVFLDERTAGRVASLEEVRGDVLREWEHARREELTEDFYRGLEGKYEVRVDWPEGLGPERDAK